MSFDIVAELKCGALLDLQRQLKDAEGVIEHRLLLSVLCLNSVFKCRAVGFALLQ